MNEGHILKTEASARRDSYQPYTVKHIYHTVNVYSSSILALEQNKIITCVFINIIYVLGELVIITKCSSAGILQKYWHVYVLYAPNSDTDEAKLLR